MQVKVKLLRGARVPEYKTEGSVGLDLAWVADGPWDAKRSLAPGATMVLPSGVVIELPKGCMAQVCPRSSMSKRGGLVHVGTVDTDYRGEIGITITNVGRAGISIVNGERIAQLVISPVAKAELVVADDLSKTARGAGGYGSTGIA